MADDHDPTGRPPMSVTDRPSPEDVARAESARFAAVLSGDVDALSALCDPRLRYTHSTGVTDTYAEYLRKCREGVWDFHTIDHPVDDIVVTADAALVFGRMHATLTTGGAGKQLHMNTLSVWVSGVDGLRLVAFQPTVLPA